MKIYKKSRVTNLGKAPHHKRTILEKGAVKLSSFYKKTLCLFQGWSSKKTGERGDTIVEVVLATAIIATAIGIAYSVANRNLQNGVSAGQRSQALSLASAQIERLKNAYLSNSSDLNKYTIDKPFCILSNGSVEDVDKQDSKCTNFNATQFSLNINYKSDDRLFTAKSTWRSNTNAAITDELTLYYKLPGSQSATTGGGTSDTGGSPSGTGSGTGGTGTGGTGGTGGAGSGGSGSSGSGDSGGVINFRCDYAPPPQSTYPDCPGYVAPPQEEWCQDGRVYVNGKRTNLPCF